MSAFALLLPLLLASPGGTERTPAVEGVPASYSGTAYDPSTGKALYIEEHREIREGGRRIRMTTEYRDPSGRLIVKRFVSFEQHPTVPEFRTEDLRSGYIEGSEPSGDSVRLYWRRSWSDPMQEKAVKIPGPAAVDAGFNNFVQSRWDRLMRGETATFNFGVPFALDYFAFRVYREREEQRNGRRLVTMVCDIDNFLLRLFVKPIVLTYDADVRRLVSYEGISNINNDDGKSYTVRIVYDPYGP